MNNVDGSGSINGGPFTRHSLPIVIHSLAGSFFISFFSFFFLLFRYHQFHECFQHEIKTCLKMCVHSLHNFFLCQLFASFHFALKILHAFSSSKKEQRPPFAQSVVHCFVGFHMKCLEELCSCVSTFASNSSCSFVMWMISQGFERTFAFFSLSVRTNYSDWNWWTTNFQCELSKCYCIVGKFVRFFCVLYRH